MRETQMVVGVGPDDEWFANRLLRPDGAGPFLNRVRGLAPEALRDLVSPAETAAFTLDGDLLVVEVSRLSVRDLDVSLQVLWRGGVLRGCWADDHYLRDGPLGDTEELIADRVENSDWAGGRAVEWLADQLRRPIDHEVSLRSEAPIAERRSFADSSAALLQRGRQSVLGTPPSSVCRVRPA